MSLKSYVTRRLMSGTSIAELPMVLWIFLIGLCFPLMGLVTMCFRYTSVYMAIRDCCYKAAVAPDSPTALAVAQKVFQNDSKWTGVPVASTEPKVVIVQRSLASGAEQEFPAAAGLPTIANVQQYQYFVRCYATAYINPIINVSGSPRIAGLTGPYEAKFVYQQYAENTDGLYLGGPPSMANTMGKN